MLVGSVGTMGLSACWSGAPGSGAPDGGSPRYVVVEAWPRLPADWALGDVAAVAVDSHEHVFVFHRGAEHSIFAVEAGSGEVVLSFGSGQFERAHGIAVDSQDNIWVADVGRHQVLKFSHDGILQMALGERGIPGSDAHHFDKPTDVAVASDGTIFVSDGYGNRRVAKFSSDGRFLGEGGGFELPHGIGIDARGQVYVADRAAQRVYVHGRNGALLSELGPEVLGPTGRPWGREISQGRLYVIDGGDMDDETPNRARLTRIGPDGSVEAVWGAYGIAPGQLLWGHDVAVGSDGSVYSAEVRDADRVQKFMLAD